MISIAAPMVGEEEKKKVLEAIDSGFLTHGPFTDEFEKKLAEYSGYKHAIAVNSGTAALHVALMAAGFNEKSRIAIPDFSFIASANAVKYIGATPVYVDIDEKTFNMSPEALRAVLRKEKVDAIMPVSLYGQPYDVDAINAIAKEAGIPVISDNCQSIGAKWNGKRNLGDLAACLSFYPTKNMTTGEGGAILTDSDDLAAKAKIIKNVGMRARYEYLYVGFNYRMTNTAAAIGLEQLKKLPGFTSTRQSNASKLNELLKGVKEVQTPHCDSRAEHVYHQYTIRAKNRDGLKAHLEKMGIGCAVYYPAPLHTIGVLKAGAVNCPVTEKIGGEVLSLPVHPKLTSSNLEEIANAIKSFYKV